MPTEAELSRARRAFEAADRPLLRRDLFELISPRYVAEIAGRPDVFSSPERLAASRLIWLLAREGSVCFAHREGSEQAYAHRTVWLPEVDWSPRDVAEAATVMVRRYLASFAPATAVDVAHFFGARVGSVKAWLGRLAPELADVECGDRRGLLALAEDLPALGGEPPSAPREWPLRLLPQWDLQTMTHKDKSWVTPRPADAKRVWRKAGVNAATVIDRGRFVATWSYRTTARRLFVTVEPLSGWRRSHLAPVEREVAAIAAHLELPEHEVAIEA
jgi:hypothetical protein